MILYLCTCGSFSKAQEIVSFVQPTNIDVHFVNNPVIVLLSYKNSLDGSVTQSCGPISILTHPVTTNTEKSFDLPPDYIGPCTYTASFPGLIFVVPIIIYISGRITIDTPANLDPPLAIPAGTSTPIFLSYEPIVNNLTKTFKVWLDCGIPDFPSAWKMIEAGVIGQTFPIPSNFYGSTCGMFVSDPEGFETYRSTTTALVITQQLSIEFPTKDQVITIPNPVPFRLKTGEAELNLFIDAAISCPDSSVQAYFNSYVTNLFYNYKYSVDYFGSCFVVVDPTSLPSYLLQAPDQTFSLKYAVKFTIHPLIVVLNNPFNIEVSTSTPASPSLTPMRINLICDGSLLDSWPSTSPNEVNTLIYNTQRVSSRSNCIFSTPPNDLIFLQTTIPVSLSSPIGGSLYKISNEELVVFLQSVSFAPLEFKKLGLINNKF